MVTLRGRVLSLGNLLVVAQVTLAAIILVGAGLMVHTLTNLRRLDPGFDANNILLFDIDPSHSGHQRGQANEPFRQLRERLEALPGVASASYSEASLLSGNLERTSLDFRKVGSAEEINISPDLLPVGRDFFETMRISQRAGRTFTEADFALAAANRAAG